MNRTAVDFARCLAGNHAALCVASSVTIRSVAASSVLPPLVRSRPRWSRGARFTREAHVLATLEDHAPGSSGKRVGDCGARNEISISYKALPYKIKANGLDQAC
jgi:hypothetical protein